MAGQTKSPSTSKGENGVASGKDDIAPTPDRPLLSNDAVIEMIKAAKKRGYVTHQQINAVLPSQEARSEQIENVLTVLNEMGIDTVEQEHTKTDEEEKADEPGG